MQRPLSVAGCVCLFLALGVSHPAWAQKQKTTTCGSDVYVNVHVSGTPADTAGYAIVSDGSGSYDHGADRDIVARFQVENCTQDFTLNLSGTPRSLIVQLSDRTVTSWFFNLDRVHSVPVTPAGPDPVEGPYPNLEFLGSTFCQDGIKYSQPRQIRRNADGSYQDNYAGCWLDETGTAYVRRAGTFVLDPDARLAFNVSPLDNATACPGDGTNLTCFASYLRVYHPVATQWIIVPEPPADAHFRLWVNGRLGFVSRGLETVPFRIVADRQ